MYNEFLNFMNLTIDNFKLVDKSSKFKDIYIENKFKNIIYNNKKKKNYKYLKYLNNIFQVIDKNIKNKKIVIFTELNWKKSTTNKLRKYNLSVDDPKIYLKIKNNSINTFLFFISNEINQKNIKILYDKTNKIYIKQNDIIQINEKPKKIIKINNENKIILDDNYNFYDYSLFKIKINKKYYKINFNDLEIKNLSKNQFKYLNFIYKNNLSNIIDNNDHLEYILKNASTFFFITKNSLNYFKADNIYFNDLEIDNRFNYISKTYFNYNQIYNIKQDGYIIIYLNNSTGFFQNYSKLRKNLKKLITNIRTFNKKNKIKIRFHPKEKEKFKIELIDYLNKNKDFNVSIDDQSYKKMIKNVYCVFIQNSKIILDLWNDGVLIFSSKISSVNIFPEDEDYCNNLEYISNLELYIKQLPNRKEILKKYYKSIVFYDEIFTNKKYIIDLFNKII